VQVAAADGGPGHAHQHFPGAGAGDRERSDLQRAISGKDDAFHHPYVHGFSSPLKIAVIALTFDKRQETGFLTFDGHTMYIFSIF
jgi:hypothetical protein